MKVPFYRHELGAAEKAAAADVIDSLFLTTGPRTREFEERFADLFSASHCVGTSSCTTALTLALHAVGVSRGDEVITTPMTFIATSNAVLHLGANPVFVDVEADTGNLDVAQVEGAITPRTKAIVPVHLYGQMVDMRALATIAKAHDLAIVEDCAHAVESERDGVRPGELSDAACFSFYATKNLTSGEGGAVVTKRKDVDEQVRLLRNHGMSKNAYQRYQGAYEHWDMVALGHKANLFDLQAALLLAQLPFIAERHARRQEVAARYDDALARIEGITVPSHHPQVRHAQHLYTVWVEPSRRDAVLTRLQEQEIGVAVNYRAVHLLSYYRDRFGFETDSFPHAERIGASTLSLPLFPSMRSEEIDRVVDGIRAALG